MNKELLEKIIKYARWLRENTDHRKTKKTAETTIEIVHAVLEGKLPQDDLDIIFSGFGAVFSELSSGPLRSNKEMAIICYEEALKVCTRNTVPIDWARRKYNLGQIYQERIKGDHSENQEMAIKCFKDALEVYTRQAMPMDWASTKNCLSNIYAVRIEGAPSDNQEMAIKCYKEALEIYTRESSPMDWAHVKNNLGNVYSSRIEGTPSDNQEMAIKCFENALKVYTREDTPMEWATTKSHLGSVYSLRIQGDPFDNQKMAIKCHKEALTVCTRKTHPMEWASINCNFGISYQKRTPKNQEMAIKCFENALKVYTREDTPMEWATVKNNLGISYNDHNEGDNSNNQEMAINFYKEALEVWTRDAVPMQWAMVKNNLGAVYRNRNKGESSSNWKMAIKCFEDALEVWTREAVPMKWATVKKNLGVAYRKRNEEERSNNQELAIKFFKEALEVWTRRAVPMEWANTQYHLGSIYYGRDIGGHSENQNRAILIFESIVNLLEEVRSTLANDISRKCFMDKYLSSYDALISLLIKKEDFQKTFYWLERTRSRILLENIDLESIKPEKPAAQEKALIYWTLCKEIRGLRDRLQIQGQNLQASMSTKQQRKMQMGVSTTTIEDLQQKIEPLMKERMLCLNVIKEIDPQYVLQITGQPPTNDEISRFLLQQEAAALSFQVLANTIYSLVILPDGKGLNITLFESSADDIIDKLNSWLDIYHQDIQIQDIKRLMKDLENLLKSAGRIMQPIIQMIHNKGITRLFISPHKFLNRIPFHAAILPESGSYLLDAFQVSYTPALTLSYMLHRFRDNRPETTPGYIYGVFCSPQGSNYLSFGEQEVRYLKTVYPEGTVFLKMHQEATIEELLQLLDSHSGIPIDQLIFSCHGYNSLMQPEVSGLYLTDGKPAGHPYLCRASLVTKSELLSRLQGRQIRSVVLCACETGQSSLANNETDEYIGLDSIFMQMRVPAIISSLYRIYDASTAALMMKYHDYHKTGISAGQALWQAQKEMKNNGFHSTRVDPYTQRGHIKDTAVNHSADMRHPLHWAFMKYSGLFV